jgi:hypothetical protein
LVLNLSLALGVVALVGLRALMASIGARVQGRDSKRRSPLERRARALAALQDLAQQSRAAATPQHHERTYDGIRILDAAGVSTNVRFLRYPRSTPRTGRDAIGRQVVESCATVAYLPTRHQRDQPATPDVA